jgi:large subunit ribosomal protein L19e
MRLTNQKKLAGKILGCASDRIWINPERVADVKEAVTREDVKALISDGLISKKQKTGQSRVRARIRLVQRRKGRLKGTGSRKGKKTAREGKKIKWINKIRVQRALLKKLRENSRVEVSTYRNLVLRAKGGFFRSRRHIKHFIEERGLINKK